MDLHGSEAYWLAGWLIGWLHASPRWKCTSGGSDAFPPAGACARLRPPAPPLAPALRPGTDALRKTYARGLETTRLGYCKISAGDLQASILQDPSWIFRDIGGFQLETYRLGDCRWIG